VNEKEKGNKKSLSRSLSRAKEQECSRSGRLLGRLDRDLWP
jgi:hypothetical protein